MLDPVEFGKAMAGIVREATAPLLKRIEALEAIKPEKGEPGERGADAPPVTDEQIFSQVSKFLSANPPARGEKGEAGEKGEPGPAGKDAEPIDVRTVVRELIESDELLSLVELRVKEEVSRLPPPKDGKDGAPGEKGEPGTQGPKGDPGQDGAGIRDLLIDRDGALVATFTDGRTKSLGVVVGRDGAPGRDGKDGADFTEARFDYDGERTLKAIGKGGEVVYRLPIPIDRGYWKKGAYEKSDVVTEGGTAYIALRETSEKPSPQSADWRILARKGRDGTDGRNGIDKTAPVKVDGNGA
jgi:hypothetical protein